MNDYTPWFVNVIVDEVPSQHGPLQLIYLVSARTVIGAERAGRAKARDVGRIVSSEAYPCRCRIATEINRWESKR